MFNVKDVFPFNLAAVIFGNEEAAREIYLPGFTEMLDTLTEREKSLLLMRYQDKLTLNECSKNFDVCRERIRQIEAKAIRKLRHPSRSTLFMSIQIKMLRCLLNERGIQNVLSTHVADTIKDNMPACNVFEFSNFVKQMSIPVENLNISSRCHNALIVARIFTLGDIVNTSESELMKLKGIGTSSVSSIKKCLDEYGVSLKPVLQNDMKRDSSANSKLKIPVKELGLSVRAYNCLIRSGRETLGDIVNTSENDLRQIRNIGSLCANEIIECVTKHRLKLKE